jgi:quercetin dioxygenase-like cupin family protein
VQVLRGGVISAATGNSVKLQAGMVLQLEANIPHSVTAQTDAVMLVTMTPSPSFHSLERDLFQQAAPLVKRMSEEA